MYSYLDIEFSLFPKSFIFIWSLLFSIILPFYFQIINFLILNIIFIFQRLFLFFLISCLFLCFCYKDLKNIQLQLTINITLVSGEHPSD